MTTDIRSIRAHTRSYINRKPYRTKAQKLEARRLARLVDGHWVSSAPVTLHIEAQREIKRAILLSEV